jgi:serine/threonine-protein kinase
MRKRRQAGGGMPALGQLVGPYRLEALLGEGGMGHVFRATDRDGTVVALKLMRAELAREHLHTRRFLREARAATRVRHPHLVGVLDAGEADGRRYLAMPYVDGPSLLQRLEQDGPLPLEAVVQVTCDVASGLDALHGAGIVHRDIKPSNIMLDGDGRAALTDFGLSKGREDTTLTRAGQLLGTMDYLAPEVLRGGEPGPASDVYALGCVVFECLAGLPPFGHRELAEVGTAHLEAEPPDPCAGRAEAAPQVSQTVLLALAKAPEARPPTATAFARMLTVSLTGR